MQILAPAITLAQYGCCIPERLARDWGKQRDKLRRNRAASELFLFGGETPQPGTLHKQPALARTLTAIAKNGAREFYQGTGRRRPYRHAAATGWVHAVEDFVEFAPEYVTPISVGYRGYDRWECPPNGQGIVPMLMVKGLEAFDLGKWRR